MANSKLDTFILASPPESEVERDRVAATKAEVEREVAGAQVNLDKAKAKLAKEEAELAKENAEFVKAKAELAMKEAEHTMDDAKDDMKTRDTKIKASKAKLDKTSESDIAYAAAKAQHEKDEVELERAQKKHALAKAQHDEAVARLKVANAELDVSQAKLTSSSTLDDNFQRAQTVLRDALELLKWAVSELGKAAASLKKTETELKAAKVKLKITNMKKSQRYLAVAQANFAAFVKGYSKMSWDQEMSKDFTILEAPSITDSGGHRALFPFNGKGLDYTENEVHKLLLRKSHNGLYHLILTHLFARTVGHPGFQPVFLVRGPPGTGKSVMLNLVWYVAFFELKMNVICHNSAGHIHLYSPGRDVTQLSKKDVKDWLLDESTVYLFDPDERTSTPVFHDDIKATSVIATSPNVKHYDNLLPRIHAIPKFPGILPLWSYGWTKDEIKKGLLLLGKDVTEMVKDVIPAVVGNFRVALQTAPSRTLEDVKDPIFSAHKAYELLSAAITGMSSDDFQRLGSVKSADYLTELLYTSDAKQKFQLSHSIVTQMAPKLDAPEVGGISELIEEFKEIKATTSTKDLLARVTTMVRRLTPSHLYHRNYSLEWANDHA